MKLCVHHFPSMLLEKYRTSLLGKFRHTHTGSGRSKLTLLSLLLYHWDTVCPYQGVVTVSILQTAWIQRMPKWRGNGWSRGWEIKGTEIPLCAQFWWHREPIGPVARHYVYFYLLLGETPKTFSGTTYSKSLLRNLQFGLMESIQNSHLP